MSDFIRRRRFLCKECGKRVARDLHHKKRLIDGGSPFCLGNIEFLCHPCHQSRHTERRRT